VLNLASLLEDSATRWPTRDAVVCGDTRLNYADLDAATNRVANLLVTAGIQPGDRVALSCTNIPQFPIIYYGILKAGAVVVPMNVLLKAREIAYHLTDSSAKAYFCFEGGPGLPLGEEGRAGFDRAPDCAHFFPITSTLNGFLADASPVFESVPVSATDTAVILYTSGTTGTPKGAELTHANMVLNALTCHRLFGTVENEVHLVALPLFHSFGQTCSLNCAIRAGGTLTLLPRFDPAKALEIIGRDRVTVFLGVPTMYSAMLHDPSADTADTACLEFCGSGGAAMPVEIMKAFEEKFGCKVLEGYGLSETSPVASFNHPDKERKAGSIGTPIEGVEMKVVDDDDNDVEQGEVGEIAIKGHNVMKGYWKRPEATAEAMKDGWFATGDIATRDADGYYFIVDRKKDMIIRGGYNVYPREVEEVLYAHAAIAEAAVIGIEHPTHGEEVKAVVVLKIGASATEQEIIDHCREHLAAYKYPRVVEFREELPKTATGKILKRELRL